MVESAVFLCSSAHLGLDRGEGAVGVKGALGTLVKFSEDFYGRVVMLLHQRQAPCRCQRYRCKVLLCFCLDHSRAANNDVHQLYSDEVSASLQEPLLQAAACYIGPL